MKNAPIPRLDKASELHDCLVKRCRLGVGDVWQDPLGRHKVGCLDAARQPDALKLMGTDKASLAIQDPPYNLAAFERKVRAPIGSRYVVTASI